VAGWRESGGGVAALPKEPPILYERGATTARRGFLSLILLPGIESSRRAFRKPIVIKAHPNPTTGKSWAVISVELDDAAMLRVSDPQGRVVNTLRLAAGQRLVELDLMGLATGLYTCELLQGEYKLGVTKVTMQR